MLDSLTEFNKLIADWMLKPEEEETEETHPWKISEEELLLQKDRVCFADIMKTSINRLLFMSVFSE